LSSFRARRRRKTDKAKRDAEREAATIIGRAKAEAHEITDRLRIDEAAARDRLAEIERATAAVNEAHDAAQQRLRDALGRIASLTDALKG
jgi:FtsZ-binding cell division protein ZapB